MPDNKEKSFNLILEPVSKCNLQCVYCYSDGTQGSDVMSLGTLRASLERTAVYVKYNGIETVHLLWHGGEPLLAGLDFYQEAVLLTKQMFSDIRVLHFLQTNGLLLDQSFSRFFRDHSFNVGISLDALPELHDPMRASVSGLGSHAQVMEKLDIAKESGLKVGFNTVVNRLSLGKEKGIYKFFQEFGSGFRVNPIIPAADPDKTSEYCLCKGEYGVFLCNLFEEWIQTEYRRVPVSPLDMYLRAMLNDSSSECQQCKTCVGLQIGIKPSGDAVLCSRFNDHILGNISDMPLDELFLSPLCKDINRRAGALTGCHSCEYWSMCHGGCPHNALVFSGDYMAKDYFCADYQLTFRRIQETLKSCREDETGASNG